MVDSGRLPNYTPKPELVFLKVRARHNRFTPLLLVGLEMLVFDFDRIGGIEIGGGALCPPCIGGWSPIPRSKSAFVLDLRPCVDGDRVGEVGGELDMKEEDERKDGRVAISEDTTHEDGR